MAGGSGTRLWPLSRSKHPKQFLTLHGDRTMLQSTMERLAGLNIESSITICNEEHRFLVAEQLREIGCLGSIILEPVGRNTAPAIALAALSAKDDPLLLVLAADHVIQDEKSFIKTVSESIPLAEAGKLVTFGIVPTEAHTGYGYVQGGEEHGVGFDVNRFVEKPNLEEAQNYLFSGDYFWNSGIFLFRASRYLTELNKFRPDILGICKKAIISKKQDSDFTRIDEITFEACPSESIDYAVMEKTNDAVVVPINAGWSDIGSWESLWSISEKDENGNASEGDVLMHDTNNSFIRTDQQLVSTLGVDNLVVIATKDVVMVASQDRVQDIKLITSRLQELSRPEWEIHREVYRPWGKYDSIDVGNGFQVKHITVKPGAKLSLQFHHYRAEHWVVVSGSARVTKGDKTFTLAESESTYIGNGVVHALENIEKVDLEIIEVQTGSYLGEDDIIRLDDRYGRAKNNIKN